MKVLFLATTALLLMGCDSAPSPTGSQAPKPLVAQSTGYWVTLQGTVRFVSYSQQDPHSSVSNVVIETDEHQVLTVRLLDPVPPVWVGLHGIFIYESASREQGLWKNFEVWKRLPEPKQP